MPKTFDLIFFVRLPQNELAMGPERVSPLSPEIIFCLCHWL